VRSREPGRTPLFSLNVGEEGLNELLEKFFFGDLFVSYATGFTSARSFSFCGEPAGKATFASENGVPR